MTETPTERSLFEAPPMGEQERMVEAVLFASAEPVTLAELVSRLPEGSDPAEALVTRPGLPPEIFFARRCLPFYWGCGKA